MSFLASCRKASFEQKFFKLMRILLPTDFSLCSSRALEVAAAILSKKGGSLHLLHAYHPPVVDANMAVPSTLSGFQEMKESAAQSLSELQDRAERIFRLSNVEVSTHLEVGLAIDVILEQGSSLEADVIVMGTDGASGIGEALLGTLTAELMGKSQIPVLSVPLSSSIKSLGRVAYATDFSSLDAQAIERLMSFIDHFDFHLCLVHVEKTGKTQDESKIKDWYQDKIAKLSSSDQISMHFQTADNVEEGLQHFINQEGIGMLAMLMRERGVLDKLLHPSHTKKMAFHSSVPVLALHA